MPALYLNSEVGACATEELAKHCITRTMATYEVLKKHISELHEEQDALAKLQLCFEPGKGSFIGELHHKLDKKVQAKITIFLKELSKGSIVHPPSTHTKTLKKIDVPSPFLEYVFDQGGMALSFASDAYWEADFIEFNECDAAIPNIWGQSDFSSIDEWLIRWQKKATTFFSKIKHDFDVEFCDDAITESSFTLHEWSMIYSAFQKANHKKFEVAPPLINSWRKLPIFYIRDRNHSSFTMRIFFIKQGETVYVGEIYHKNEENTLKEERAADSSYKKFRELGLL